MKVYFVQKVMLGIRLDMYNLISYIKPKQSILNILCIKLWYARSKRIYNKTEIIWHKI